MRRPVLFPALLALLPLAIPLAIPLAAPAAQAAPARGPSFDCAKAAQPVEKAICADEALAAMDRLLDRFYRLALSGLPAEPAAALKGDQVRWLLERAAAFKKADGDPAALAGQYDRRLRAVIAKAGPRILPAALAAAQPIDPLANAGAEAEEDAAFVAYVLTTLHPDPPSPGAGGEAEVLSPYERYAGFTFTAALPDSRKSDSRLFVAVAEDCGAYQCTVTPFLLDKSAGTAARLAVEVAENGKRRADPNAHPLGIPSVQGDRIELFEQARGAGDCGTKWRYRLEGTTLALVEAVEKKDCDGKGWGGPGTVVRPY